MKRTTKQDFRIPFKWEDRKPFILDGLLYIPSYYDKHHLFEKIDYFENTNPINIEYCSGNGQWIVEKAKQNPNINYIAVEMKFDRSRKIWIKRHNENLKNLFVVMGEAFVFTRYYLNDESISNVFINFPDPWPKKKHEKNRLVTNVFIDEVSRVMKKNKIITLVTDDFCYLSQIIEAFLKKNEFSPVYSKPFYIQNIKDFGDSYFDTLFRNKKKIINYLRFKKK